MEASSSRPLRGLPGIAIGFGDTETGARRTIAGGRLVNLDGQVTEQICHSCLLVRGKYSAGADSRLSVPSVGSMHITVRWPAYWK